MYESTLHVNQIHVGPIQPMAKWNISIIPYLDNRNMVLAIQETIQSIVTKFRIHTSCRPILPCGRTGPFWIKVNRTEQLPETQAGLWLVNMPYAAMLAILDRKTFQLVSFLPVSFACCQIIPALNIRMQKLIYMYCKCWNIKNVFELVYNCDYIVSLPGRAVDTLWLMVKKLLSHWQPATLPQVAIRTYQLAFPLWRLSCALRLVRPFPPEQLFVQIIRYCFTLDLHRWFPQITMSVKFANGPFPLSSSPWKWFVILSKDCLGSAYTV